MKLDLKELLVGTPTRLRYVVRFSTCHKVHPENVAEHSYYVALYSMWLYDWVCANSELEDYISLEELLRGALLHDLEEASTGDVNRLFKYSTPGLADAMHQAAREQFRTMLIKLFPSSDARTFTQIKGDQDTWDDCKNAQYWTGRILRFADFLSVLSYMMQELTNANITMRQHWTTMYAYAAEFDAPIYDFLRPLVNDARLLMEEAFYQAQGSRQ